MVPASQRSAACLAVAARARAGGRRARLASLRACGARAPGLLQLCIQGQGQRSRHRSLFWLCRPGPLNASRAHTQALNRGAPTTVPLCSPACAGPNIARGDSLLTGPRRNEQRGRSTPARLWPAGRCGRSSGVWGTENLRGPVSVERMHCMPWRASKSTMWAHRTGACEKPRKMTLARPQIWIPSAPCAACRPENAPENAAGNGISLLRPR